MTSLDLNSPLQQAVAQMAARKVTASPMTSREWELLPAEVRLRAMFSARVEHERTLAEMQSRITAGLAGQKVDGATMDKSRFVAEMRAMIKTTGYKRPDGTHRKSVQNLRSRARLELIWDMNQAQAVGYAKWLTDMDPDLLEVSPCYELVRVKARVEVRDWPIIWEDHGGKFYGGKGSNKYYPGAKGRMIAKKTDPIWRYISRFKSPWPPFDWGSGMGLRAVRLAEAEDLGVIGPDDAPQTPLTEPFNANASASVAGIPEDRVQAILRDFAGDVEIVDGRLQIIPPKARSAMAAWSHPGEAEIPVTRSTTPVPPLHGKPLVSLLTIQPSAGKDEWISVLKDSAAAAQQVHGGGNLIPATASIGRPMVSYSGAGEYLSIESLDSKRPPSIWLESNFPSTEEGRIHLRIAPLIALHEMGHWIDNVGLHTPAPDRRYASVFQPELEEIILRLRQTVAVSRLAHMWPKDHAITTPEVFARAYAQFIVEKSGTPQMKQALYGFRKGEFESAGYPRDFFWTHPDFTPARKLLELLFAQGGWKGGAR